MEYQRVHRLSLFKILSSKLISILTEKYLRLSLLENFVRLPKLVDAIAIRTGMETPIYQESICECHCTQARTLYAICDMRVRRTRPLEIGLRDYEGVYFLPITDILVRRRRSARLRSRTALTLTVDSGEGGNSPLEKD
jgi:hypothetical protein